MVHKLLLPFISFSSFLLVHRNITEHSYPSIVESRRAAMTEADLALIRQFSATKHSEYQATIGQQNLAPEVRRMISILLVILGIFIVLMVGQGFTG